MSRPKDIDGNDIVPGRGETFGPRVKAKSVLESAAELAKEQGVSHVVVAYGDVDNPLIAVHPVEGDYDGDGRVLAIANPEGLVRVFG